MNYSYRKFKKTDFNEIFKIFLKFQEAIKIETFYNLTKDQSDNFTNIFLMSELKKLVSENQTYVGLCEGEIFAFACFSESVYRSDGIDLQIVCKDPKKPFSFKMKALLLEVFKEAKKDFKRGMVLCALGPRFKFDSYKSFVIRIFKPKIIRKGNFNKTIIIFND